MEWIPNSTTEASSTPTPINNITELCREKAWPLEYRTPDRAEGVPLFFGMFTTFLATVVIFNTWLGSDSTGKRHRRPIAELFVASISFMMMWICLLIVKAGINYHFYCVADLPNLKKRNRHYLLAGILVGPFLLIASADWLWLLITAFVWKLRMGRVWRSPGYYIVVTVCAILWLIPFAIMDIFCLVRHILYRDKREFGKRDSFFGTRLVYTRWKERIGNQRAEAEDIELAHTTQNADGSAELGVEITNFAVRQRSISFEQELRPDDSVSMRHQSRPKSTYSGASDSPPQYRYECSVAPSYHSRPERAQNDDTRQRIDL